MTTYFRAAIASFHTHCEILLGWLMCRHTVRPSTWPSRLAGTSATWYSGRFSSGRYNLLFGAIAPPFQTSSAAVTCETPSSNAAETRRRKETCPCWPQFPTGSPVRQASCRRHGPRASAEEARPAASDSSDECSLPPCCHRAAANLPAPRRREPR